MRLAVHTDFEYHSVDGEIRGEHAFTLFFVGLAEHLDRLVLLGRLDPASDRGRYGLGPRIEFVPMPYYESLVHGRQFAVAAARALRRFWRTLDEVDGVWLLGPHPLQVGFAVLAAVRRRKVIVGVRQDFPSYVASRHPGRPLVGLAGRVLELVWRFIARLSSAVVVGPELARNYRRAPRLLEIKATLTRDADVVDEPPNAGEAGEPPFQILSVGRIEEEKNPLLLADVLALLRAEADAWRLVVVGEGPMQDQLQARLRAAGLDGAAALEGYVPYGPDLIARYRKSDVLLHVSWTEGLPQVLIEAFAAGLPVVATDVGGIREAVGDAVLLIPPGDAQAAAAGLRRIADDPNLRAKLIEAGLRHTRAHTLESETRRLAHFLTAGGAGPARPPGRGAQRSSVR